MSQQQRTFTRRAVVAGACGAACAVTVAGCAGYVPAQSQRPPASSSGGATTSARGNAGGAGDTALARTAEIPVGGGKIFEDEQVVVTQPARGTFKAFDTTCTHAGCTVNAVTGGTINCPCHGSKYDITDGSVADGPAPAPLAAKQINVNGDSISLA